VRPDRESASLLAEVLADADADFATEHCDFTVGDRERGGPEGIPEPESPKGYGGADIHRSRRLHTPHAQVIMALTTPHAAPAKPHTSPQVEPLTVPTAAPVASPPTSPQVEPLAAPMAVPPLEPLAEPLSEAEPDFALEHRHLTVGGSDLYHTRRRH